MIPGIFCVFSGFHEVIPYGKAHQLAEAGEVHLAHDVIAVAFDGASGDARLVGDFLIAAAIRKQLDHFDFSGGQGRSGNETLFRRTGAMEKILAHGNSELAGEIGLVMSDMVHGNEQVGIRVGFQDIGKGATGEDLTGELLGEMHAEDEDVDFG